MKAWTWVIGLIHAAGVGVVATAGNILTYIAAMWISDSGPVEPDMMSIAPLCLLICNIVACEAIVLVGDWRQRSDVPESGGLSVLSVTVMAIVTTIACSAYNIAYVANGYAKLSHWMLSVAAGYCIIAAATILRTSRKRTSEVGKEVGKVQA